jgi:hypothetical protein
MDPISILFMAYIEKNIAYSFREVYLLSRQSDNGLDDFSVFIRIYGS